MKKADPASKRLENPFWLALAAFSLSLLLMLAGKLISMSGLIDLGARFAWMIAGTFVLCFSLFNTLIYLGVSNINPYWIKSVVSFILLALLSAAMAWLFSGIALRDAGSYKWIFTVLTFAYLIFISIVQLMRKIVELAKREDRRKND